MAVEITEATEATAELVEAFERLAPQLSSSNPPPSAEALDAIVASDATRLLMATADGVIVGSLTLVLVRIPTGLRAVIEDVVVDEQSRGQGVGRALNEAALEMAQAAGAVTVDLTSRPSREAANHLYLRLGFEVRDTNVYRYRL
ncbi:MAG: GNAT family N-acetyltransferase [bacterium]|nr:GNAT family N-acetyltransferase [bacterium]